MEDFYGDGSLARFDANRSRLMKSTQGIAENNRQARLKSFERAMKAQFGPNVIVSPDGIATRKGKTVGNLDAFMKAGGKLQGTPRDPRSALQIQQKEDEKIAANAPTFEERMNTIFPDKQDERISSKTFEQEQELDLNAMSEYADTGEQDPGDYTDLEKLVSSGSDKTGNNGSSTRNQLKTTSRAVGPAGISDRNVPKGYIRTEGKLQSVKSVKGQRAKLRLDRLRKLQAKIKAGK